MNQLRLFVPQTEPNGNVNSGQRLRGTPSEAYDRRYLLSEQVEGFIEFQEGALSLVKERQLQMLQVTPGVSVLEVGYGRGELLRHCALHGAKVTGVDYSKDAFEIASATLADFPEADIRIADCRNLPFPEGIFDRVIAGDVIEHLDAEDGVTMLREIRRVLKPGGTLIVHTSPNAVFMRWIYPVARILLRRLSPQTIDSIDKTRRLANEKRLHLKEYSLLALQQASKEAGLAGAAVWIEADLLRSSKHRFTQDLGKHPLIRFVNFCGRFSFVRYFLGNDLYVKYTKQL